jgi:hypothetical protein
VYVHPHDDGDAHVCPPRDDGNVRVGGGLRYCQIDHCCIQTTYSKRLAHSYSQHHPG